MNHTIHVGDCTTVKPDGLFHAVLCDPPYELGFMGKDWDASGVAFHADTWRKIGESLHPGGFLMAFASSRGWHRLACAIEDAGFIIHPTIMGWANGAGFPKATRIYECDCHRVKQKAKRAMSGVPQADISQTRQDGDAERGDVLNGVQEQGVPKLREASDEGDEGGEESGMEGRSDLSASARELRSSAVCEMPETAPSNGKAGRVHHGASAGCGNNGGAASHKNGSGASHRPRPTEQSSEQLGGVAGQSDAQVDRARQVCPDCGKRLVWSGHRYGLQALKPAVEIIIVAQKRYEGKPVDCITRTGAGTMNVDGGRIGTRLENESGWSRTGSKASENRAMSGANYERPPKDEIGLGRWPANFILLDEEAAAALDRQSGVSGGGVVKSGSTRNPRIGRAQYQDMAQTHVGIDNYGDTGGASRFFYNVQSQLDAADPIRYQAKASRRERDAGLEGLPEKRVAMLNAMGDNPADAIDPVSERFTTSPAKNHHPTVKPIDLARYLATLLLPPDDYAPRRILVPFSGVGSEMIGALLAGWEEVVGIEQDNEYADIARRRIEHWTREKEKVLL